jgi:hypothetical protein
LLLFPAFGCKHNYYLFGRQGDVPPEDYRSIFLDSTYELYVRKVTKVGGEGHKDLESRQLIAATVESPLIEVEYLLLSDHHGNVIYFSTLADRFQNLYQPYYLGDGYINTEDFETILFGKMLNSRTFLFFSGDTAKHSYVLWDWRKEAEGGKINSIQEFVKGEFQLFIPAAQALQDSIFFKHVGPFSIVHHYDTPDARDTIPLQDRTIHITRDGKGWMVYFIFAQPIQNGYYNIKFLNDRVPFSPQIPQ